MKTLKTISLILGIIVLGSACNTGYDLQKEINKAVKAGHRELVIPAGRYEIKKTIHLDGIDNLTIKPEASGKVVLTSGMELLLNDFTCIDSLSGLYEISLSKLKTDPWPDAFRGYAGWPEVYISGIPMKLARWPNEGFIKIDSVINRGTILREGDSTGEGGSFISKELIAQFPGEVNGHSSPVTGHFLGGYWCYKWYDEFMRVESINQETGEVKMAAPHRYGIGGPSGGLFYAINAPEFLDQPGEYYYNRESGTIRMIIPENQTAESVVHIGYKDFIMMDIQNCSNILIDELKFSVHNGLALKVTDSDSVRIQRCDFNRLAQSAVEISGGSYCGVIGSKISFIGATGISLDGGDRPSLTPAHHYATKNMIHDFARHIQTYSPGVKLGGVGQLVNQNRIFKAPHNAILFTGNDHLIENNVIKLVCLNTSDAGAIYCGRDWTMGGTVIQNNLISELGQASQLHNWAIYLDDLVSGIDVLNNTIQNCPSGILIGGGRYNRVEGNHIYDCPKASIMYDARGLGWYKQYIDDPKNELWQRLWAMPIKESPWKDRFPWLQDIPDDDPGVPKHVIIKDNMLIKTVEPVIHPTVIEYGEVDL